MDRFPLQEGALMHRFYADPASSDEKCFVLNEEDTHHALRVLRLCPGDEAEIFFNSLRYLARIDTVSDRAVTFQPVRLLPSTEPHLPITLFQGIAKGDKMDWIVQKATELGVFRIVPVVFSRCVIRLDERDTVRKQERWQKIAREAGKQSGRCSVPEVCAPVALSAVQPLIASCSHVVVPWEDCAEGGPLSFARHYTALSSLGIVIGPEGGISPDEVNFLRSFGCTPITLGPRILRTETAGLAALSVFFGLYGEME